MRIFLHLLVIVASLPRAISQAAAGGGAPPAVIQATQDSTIREAPSIFTVNGVTDVTRIMYTQTFAATALGSWELGPTPKAGTIGLGDIQGSVGQVKGESSTKQKRELWEAMPTRWGW